MARRSPKGLRLRLVALLCVLSFVSALGAVYLAYRVQNTYAFVEVSDIVEMVNRYNQLLFQCYQRLMYYKNT